MTSTLRLISPHHSTVAASPLNHVAVAGQKRKRSSVQHQAAEIIECSYDFTSFHTPFKAAKLSSNEPFCPPLYPGADTPVAPLSSPHTPDSCIEMTDVSGSPSRFGVANVSTSVPTAFHTTGPRGSCGLEPMMLYDESKTLQPEQSQAGYCLFITDEPEENYRARYESEGCRGPMKGRNGGCPSVTLAMQSDRRQYLSGTVTVELTNSDGSLLQSCRLDSTEDGQNLSKKLQQNGEKTSFDNLRIRRLKKTDSNSTKGSTATATKKGLGRGKQDEKQAHLLFTATVTLKDNPQPIVLKAMSQPIYLNANHDPPEIHKIVPSFGSAGDSVAIIGTRMHSPRVSLHYMGHDGKDHEVSADIEKEISHQNALVVKLPQLSSAVFSASSSSGPALQIHIQVTAGKGDRTGRDPLRSNLYHFTYIKQGRCKECCMTHIAAAAASQQQTHYHAPLYIPAPHSYQPHPPITSMISPSTSSVIVTSRPPPLSPPMMGQRTPPPPQSVAMTPTSSGQVEVDQILGEFIEDPTHLVSPPPPQNSPYTAYPAHTSPVGGYATPLLPASSIDNIGLTDPTNQVKPEELEQYFPGQNTGRTLSSASSPPMIDFSYCLPTSVGYHGNST